MSRNEAFRRDDPNLFTDPGSAVTVLGSTEVNRALGHSKQTTRSLLGGS
ncbi:MAG: hypothetical protein AB1781_11190 [Pseudomonadota bacterium]